MGALTDGLQGYEIVMLGLGIILFIAVTFAFLYQVLHGKSYGTMLVFFVLPIVMVGYPSIQKFQIDGKTLTIEKTTQELQSKPDDSAVRQQLETQVSDLQNRNFSNANSLTVLAKAQYALGNEQVAAANLNKALQADPNATAARDLQSKVKLVEQVKQLATKVDSNPADSEARKQLSQSVAAVSKIPIANPSALTQIAKAQTILGEQQKAQATANKVIAINPNAPAALEMREMMKKRNIPLPTPASHP